MTLFVSHQEVKILEPLQYVAQFKIGRTWHSIHKPVSTFGDATKALLRWQRTYKKRSDGRIVIQGVVSTQTYSRSNSP